MNVFSYLLYNAIFFPTFGMSITNVTRGHFFFGIFGRIESFVIHAVQFI